MRAIRWAGFALFALTGCVSVSAHKAPGVNLSQYRTYRFYEPPAHATKQIAFEQSPTGQAIRNQVANNLQEKGLMPAPAGVEADLIVAYHAKLQQKLEYTDWGYPGGWGWGWYGGYYPGWDVTTYTEGTIIVDFVDSRTHQVVWRGTASAVVNQPENPDPSKIASAVDKMMRKVPQMATISRPAM
jgi:hypothetical protein